jgi:hypothetical protein
LRQIYKTNLWQQKLNAAGFKFLYKGEVGSSRFFPDVLSVDWPTIQFLLLMFVVSTPCCPPRSQNHSTLFKTAKLLKGFALFFLIKNSSIEKPLDKVKRSGGKRKKLVIHLAGLASLLHYIFPSSCPRNHYSNPLPQTAANHPKNLEKQRHLLPIIHNSFYISYHCHMGMAHFYLFFYLLPRMFYSTQVKI